MKLNDMTRVVTGRFHRDVPYDISTILQTFFSLVTRHHTLKGMKLYLVVLLLYYGKVT